MSTDIVFMQQALLQARHAQSVAEVPVGAIMVKDNEVIATGYNQPITHHDPTAHAEIMVMRNAAQKLQNYRLIDTTLYVTLEPCVMCIGAILHARVKRLVFGAFDPKAGAVQSIFQIADEQRLNHRLDYCGGVLEKACGDVLRAFFKSRR